MCIMICQEHLSNRSCSVSLPTTAATREEISPGGCGRGRGLGVHGRREHRQDPHGPCPGCHVLREGARAGLLTPGANGTRPLSRVVSEGCERQSAAVTTDLESRRPRRGRRTGTPGTLTSSPRSPPSWGAAAGAEVAGARLRGTRCPLEPEVAVPAAAGASAPPRGDVPTLCSVK